MKKAISVLLIAVMLSAAVFAASGDVNSDGEVNNKDVVALFRYVSGNKTAVTNEDECDINGDGSIDNKDVVALFRSVSGKQEVFEKAILYTSLNGAENQFSASKLERMYMLSVITGRNLRHICPGESFQFRMSALEPDIRVSTRDVIFSITSGAEHCTLTDDGVFTALSTGDVKITAALKAESAIKCSFTVKITEPDITGIDYWQGKGTFRDPFLINTVDDFLNIAKISKATNDYSSGGYWFKQTADLDLSGISYTPPEMFMCNYDGNGHRISNVTVDPTCEKTGLFGDALSAVIKDLTVVNYTYKRNGMSSVEHTGVFASVVNGGTFYNCYAVNIDIDVTNNGETWSVGGFVGHVAETSAFVDCAVKGSIKSDNFAGGFFGNAESTAWHTLFSCCKADVTVEATGENYGGFCWAASDLFYFNECESMQYDKYLDQYNVVAMP